LRIQLNKPGRPGFAIDELFEALGEQLVLPPFLEFRAYSGMGHTVIYDEVEAVRDLLIHV
jgi:hypothetical protein